MIPYASIFSKDLGNTKSRNIISMKDSGAIDKKWTFVNHINEKIKKANCMILLMKL